MLIPFIIIIIIIDHKKKSIICLNVITSWIEMVALDAISNFFFFFVIQDRNSTLT